jgi:TetR/AcrR family transcriptional regulator
MSSVSNSVRDTDESHHPVPRMRSEDRRELILRAATDVFGQYGYHGSTTDQVARAAGVSQPYVVRMFGTKERLFLEVIERALVFILVTFRGVLAEGGHDLHERLGSAYVEMLRQRGLLLSLMQSFVLGSDPVIGAAARRGFLEVYGFLRDEAGFTPDDAQRFLEGGMLLNTLVGLRMSDEFETSGYANELLCTALPQKLDVLLELGKQQRGAV